MWYPMENIPPVFALVDCNNCYASCEKLFRPDLKHRPVVVLSNNDGCVVARSREARALGIKMGAPFFKIRSQLQQHRVAVFSSNYTLYADISARVMGTLEAMSPQVEVYSIDEAFLDLTGVEAVMPLPVFGRQIRQRVAQWVGISVCVGIAPTKTLAKLANYAAKQYPATGGVVDLTDRRRQRRLLAITPVKAVWGVGRKISRRLEGMGITTALQLAEASPALIRKRFSVVTERTVLELNGVACLDLEAVSPPRQQIVCSRGFGQRVTTRQAMHEAICEYISRAAEKLRKDRQRARVLTVFLSTSPFSSHEPYYANSATGALVIPSDDTGYLIKLGIWLLQCIWRTGYRYAKAGVMLSDLYDRGLFQPDLFDEAGRQPDRSRLMAVMDQVNQSGRGRIWVAGQGVRQPWAMQRRFLSPAYTTRWSDIPTVT
jgi:DNA polymerase V